MRTKEKEVKMPKGVSQEFMDGLNTRQVPELKALIVELQMQNQENEAFKETPEYVQEEEAFQHAKDKFNLVAGPVKDTTISIRNRTKAVVARLKEKGQ